METVLSSLQKFLSYQAGRGIAPDLLARWSPEMETQVLVFGGEPLDGGRYTDGVRTWWPIRVPKHADSEPEFTDYKIDWPYDDHAQAIGWTGWDWVNRRSRSVGFDFDAITGHAKGVGISDDALAAVRDKAIGLPYVEVRHSTGGAGLHLYVQVDAPTANHTEHAGLARCILGMMSAECGFDFASHVDCCGGNLWLWHRKLTPGSKGLTLIKAAERPCEPPSNWRDHIDVIKRKRSKIAVPQGIENLAQSRPACPLDEQHKRLIEVLAHSGYACNWLDDHNLLQTHTKALADVFAAQKLPIVGVFATLSQGNDPGTPNCFMFPIEHGAWKVYRFSPGIHESTSWEQDGKGWTTCTYNARPPLKTACLFHGGMVDPEIKVEYVFRSTAAAIAAARAIGAPIDLPPEAEGRQIRFSSSKDGYLVVKIERSSTDGDLDGWISKKGRWLRATDVAIEEERRGEHAISDFDVVLRRMISISGETAGWKIRLKDQWCDAAKDDVRSVLNNLGTPSKEIESILGAALLNPWKLVNLPFHDEYPGDRQWNLGAAKFAVEPIEGPHPSWDAVLAHCGRDLDAYTGDLAWCQEDRIHTGADYLRAWIACLLRRPFDPLPYLFFFGEENCGKSIIHESISLLMTGGVVIADRALTNKNDFNGELANAVLCIVEEKDISKAPGAMNKIKEWVTGRNISIQKKGWDSYSQANCTHWLQCANHRRNCPVFPGDTRIVFIYVTHPETEIPKPLLMERLTEEAPAFLHTILSMELPSSRGRLRLPVITTAHKLNAEEANQDPLKAFVSANVDRVAGQTIVFNEFYPAFIDSLHSDERHLWSQKRVSGDLADYHIVKRKLGAAKHVHLIDVQWSKA